MSDITLPKLMEAGVHIGHKAGEWNPKMLPYIYNETNNVHIIDLIQSLCLLKKANEYVKNSSEKGFSFLFICTKPSLRNFVEQEAKRCNSFYINYRWLGGTLTNWSIIKKRVEDLKCLEKLELNNNFSKKEVAFKKKELKKLRKKFGGIKFMHNIPDVGIVIDQNSVLTAIKEFKTLGIPLISIVDTNCDPNIADIPIPGNDDSDSSIKLIIKSLVDNIIKVKTQLS